MANSEITQTPESDNFLNAPNFLFILNGKNMGKKVYLRFPFIIGRSQESDLCIPDNAISRSHSRLEEIDGRICITDLDSKNGTILNGKKIQRSTYLKNFDLIRIGQCLMLFNRELPINTEKFGSKNILEVAYDGETFYDEILDPREVEPSNLDREALNELFELLILFQNEFANPVSLLEKALKRIVLLFKADQASIYLVNSDTQNYEPGIILSKDMSPTVPISIIKRCAQDRKSYLHHDLWSDTQEGRLLRNIENKTRSLMVAPMLEANQCSGILAIGSMLPKYFSHRTLEMCSLVSKHLAKNLSNSSLWDKLLKRYAAEKSMSSVEFVYRSSEMNNLLKSAELIAKEKVNLLITGESGVGKEVLARFVHNCSPRADRAFVPLNCACIPENLLESELFGAEKGAYTGADEDRMGKFEIADGGTLFLDEIGELPLTLQPKLLRVIEYGKFYRLGGKVEINCNVRIISATNRDIENAIKFKQFREDLYYRINVAHLHIPPLRERTEDIVPLAEHFLRVLSTDLTKAEPFKLAPDSIPYLLSYPWYGNVRELKNVLERVSLLSSSAHLSAGSFKREIGEKALFFQVNDPKTKELVSLPEVVMEVEKNIIMNTLRETNWKKSLAAQKLGISRPTLDKKIKDYNLDVKTTE